MSEAEQAVAGALSQNAEQIAAWVSRGANGRLTVNARFSGGQVLARGATETVQGTGVRLVLQGDGAGSYHILTGFPTP